MRDHKLQNISMKQLYLVAQLGPRLVLILGIFFMIQL